jgi:hypothetical protein
MHEALILSPALTEKGRKKKKKKPRIMVFVLIWGAGA